MPDIGTAIEGAFHLPSAWHKVRLVQAGPAHWPHAAAVDEVMEALAQGFAGLGAEVSLGEPEEGARNIIFMPHMLAPWAVARLPADCILYNFEQAGGGVSLLTPGFIEAARRFPLWDYSFRNAAQLALWAGHSGVQVVPVAYMPVLSRIARAPVQDIDVLFYGSVNARRRDILLGLQQAGLNVVPLFGVYGAARDALIARAKIVLNVHAHPVKVLEIVRISYLLANRKAVVTELDDGTEVDADIAQAVEGVPYTEIVATCIRLARDDVARQNLEEYGFATFRQRDLVPLLRKAVTAAEGREKLLAYHGYGRENMLDKLRSLDQLGLDFGTDKASHHHDYLRFYARFFEPLRHEPVKLLEIGVLGGASLAVWEAYFPQGHIVGADINPASARFARGRVAIEILDQSNIEQLVQLGIKHGPFDIIIEDGSHLWEHQITSLRTLFPFVKPGGFYVAEDLQTNYGSMVEAYKGVASQSCVDYLKRLVDLRVAHDQMDIAAEEDAFLRTYGRGIHAITFVRHAALIEKSLAREDQILGEPYLPLARVEGHVPVELRAHIGMIGDRKHRDGWLRGVGPNQNIQAFSVVSEACALEYQAMLADGTWSPWVRDGVLVGTKNKGLSLRGFAIRPALEGFAVDVIGQFQGSPALVTARAGEPCAPLDGQAALCGMQVVLRRKV